MRSDAATRAALWLAVLLALTVPWGARAGAGAGAEGVEAAHLVRAALWASPSRLWEPPPGLVESDDAVLDGATAWEAVDLPHARERSVAAPAEQGSAPPQVVWYRLHVPGAALAATPQGPRLYVPRWQTVGTLAVYAGDRLVWQSRGSRVWNSFNRPVWVDLGGYARPGEPLTLHVRMASLSGVGGALSTVWAGPAEALRMPWRLRSLVQADLVSILRGAYLVLGLFALAVWLVRRRRGETVFLLFFLMSLSHLLASLFYLVDAEGFDVEDEWFSWLTLAGALGSSVCSFHFLCLAQRWRRPRLGHGMGLYAAAVVLAALPLWGVRHDLMLPLLRLALLPPALVVLGVALAGAWRDRTPASVVLAGAVVLSFPMGFHDLALQSYRVNIEHIYLTPYMYMGLFTLFLFVAFARYNGALRAAEEANATLAERLAAQAQALRASHERLRAAEREQTLLQERQRLMRDMHDGVGSSLMSALRLVERGRGTAQVDVAQVLRECIDDLKISIDSLEPVDSDLLALLAGLRFRLGPRLQGAGLELRWCVSDVPPLPWLDAQSALHVLRILQEVLTNVVKHSRASEITVTTAEAAWTLPDGTRQPGVQVQVGDNGGSFEPPSPQALPPGSKGLANVRTRARALGARCTWQPQAHGTVFTLWLPLEGRA